MRKLAYITFVSLTALLCVLLVGCGGSENAEGECTEHKFTVYYPHSEEGKHFSFCQNCNYQLVEECNSTERIVLSANCIKEGIKEVHCTLCENVHRTESIPKTVTHKYAFVKDEKYHYMACVDCHVRAENDLGTIGEHKYINREGESFCSVCGYSDGRDMATVVSEGGYVLSVKDPDGKITSYNPGDKLSVDVFVGSEITFGAEFSEYYEISGIEADGQMYANPFVVEGSCNVRVVVDKIKVSVSFENMDKILTEDGRRVDFTYENGLKTYVLRADEKYFFYPVMEDGKGGLFAGYVTADGESVLSLEKFYPDDEATIYKAVYSTARELAISQDSIYDAFMSGYAYTGLVGSQFDFQYRENFTSGKLLDSLKENNFLFVKLREGLDVQIYITDSEGNRTLMDGLGTAETVVINGVSYIRYGISEGTDGVISFEYV